LFAWDEQGKQAFRAEATKVDPKKLDEPLFKLPVNFKSGPMPRAKLMASIP
jgi:hypothetical protein